MIGGRQRGATFGFLVDQICAILFLGLQRNKHKKIFSHFFFSNGKYFVRSSKRKQTFKKAKYLNNPPKIVLFFL
jgi:hypothetical protein